jgi:UDP-2,3-diacylglucosamine hydrolase
LKAFHLPKEPQLVVASDVHVRTEGDDRYRLLCQLVDEARLVGAKALVLNGDIFDFFFGWGNYFRFKYSRLLNGLDELVKSGATVWFVVGNHEFGLEALQRHHRFSVIPCEGRVWEGAGGNRVLIAHGDLLRPDFWYNVFRAVFRSPVVNVLAWAFPQRLLDRITLWFASSSRKKDKYRVLNHERIIDAALLRLKYSGADAIIFGHFHHPYDETKGDGARFLSVSSWDNPSCIVVRADGTIERVHPAG